MPDDHYHHHHGTDHNDNGTIIYHKHDGAGYDDHYHSTLDNHYRTIAGVVVLVVNDANYTTYDGPCAIDGCPAALLGGG
jgi:hypothetical protein